jgi:hydrogenase maturation protease
MKILTYLNADSCKQAIYSNNILKILVLGIGNKILKDDGIGPAVIQELRRFSLPKGVFLETANISGFTLLDIVTGYDTLIIVDAMKSGKSPGEITWVDTDEYTLRTTIPSQHKMDIFHMLELGKQMGITIPVNVRTMAIEADDVTSFGETLSPEVAKVIPEAVVNLMEQIYSIIKEGQTADNLQEGKNKG